MDSWLDGNGIGTSLGARILRDEWSRRGPRARTIAMLSTRVGRLNHVMAAGAA